MLINYTGVTGGKSIKRRACMVANITHQLVHVQHRSCMHCAGASCCAVECKVHTSPGCDKPILMSFNADFRHPGSATMQCPKPSQWRPSVHLSWLRSKSYRKSPICFEWRAQGGGQNVHLDTLALEQGIHQLKAPFHASGLDIGIRRHGFVQLIHLAHWQW